MFRILKHVVVAVVEVKGGKTGPIETAFAAIGKDYDQSLANGDEIATYEFPVGDGSTISIDVGRIAPRDPVEAM